MILIVKQEIYHFCSLVLNTLTILIAIFVGISQIAINKNLAELHVQAYLRPVILRYGEKELISYKPIGEETEDYTNKQFQNEHFIGFEVLKNIATEVTGKIVINRKKYRLHFFERPDSVEKHKIECEAQWGWVKPGNKLFAFYSELDYEPTKEKNHLLLDYKDIQGNSYTTEEGKHTSICAKRTKL